MRGPQRLKPRSVWSLKRYDWKSYPSRSLLVLHRKRVLRRWPRDPHSTRPLYAWGGGMQWARGWRACVAAFAARLKACPDTNRRPQTALLPEFSNFVSGDFHNHHRPQNPLRASRDSLGSISHPHGEFMPDANPSHLDLQATAKEVMQRHGFEPDFPPQVPLQLADLK